MTRPTASVLLLLALAPATFGRDENAPKLMAPARVEDGWEIASLADAGLDRNTLTTLVERISTGGFKNIHSVLIVKDDKIVFEEYFPREVGDAREQALRRATPHPQYSVTKSVTSILIGIAIDQHLIRGVDEKVASFFPEYAAAFAHPENARLRLRDLLTMSSGLAWDELTYPYTDPRNDHVKMIRDDDPLRYVFERPAAAEPGTRFTYNSGLAIALGEIIHKVSGMRAEKFAERHLFEPLGITDTYWMKYPGELVESGGGLSLRPRDMAKIGRLVLDNGRWNGKPVVSQSWVEQSTRNQLAQPHFAEAFHADGYGYQWWRASFTIGDRVFDSFSARGRGGQFIFVFPALRMIAVFTGWNDNALMFQPIEIVRAYVLPATLPAAVAPETPSPAVHQDDARGKIRALLEAAREKHHVPGLSFVAVKDDKVFMLETFGLRDVARKLPVTPETVFPVGSCTKSFTSIAAGIAQDRGVLSLDDSPHKLLPWFRMADPEADTLVTLRDMLCHRTGLRAYADMAAEPAVLSREDFLRAATAAKPTAKFRAAFQYSNAIFTAAGEAVARASNTSWEALIERAILQPLGMKSSRASIEAGVALPDHALGYIYRDTSKDWKEVPAPKSLLALAPAGAVVSNARDLGQWLRFLTSGGSIDGKQLLSEATFRDVTRPHVAIDRNFSYALGWVNYKWNGHAVNEHNGGSEGICALVSYMPDRRAGFAILGNTSPSDLIAIAKIGQLLWPLLLGEAEKTAAPLPPATAHPAPHDEKKSGIATSPAEGLPSVDELFARVVAAYGGERNLRRHATMSLHARKRYENQGVEADVVIVASAPSSRSEQESWTAAGKSIGRVRTFFDGERGGQETTFGQNEMYSGDDLEQSRRQSARPALLEARKLFSQVLVDRKETLDGEETLVIKLVPKSGPAVSKFVSARTALIVKEQSGAETSTFSDYRNIDGEVVPFRTIIHDPLGETTIEALDVKFNAEIPPGSFKPAK